MSFRRGLIGAGLVAAAAITACVTDHSALEKKRNTGSGGTGGAGGQAGSSAGSGTVAGTGGTGGSGGRPGDEPPGENVLTVLHGAVDAQRIAFCFARFDAASNSAIQVGDPLPQNGLAFGRRASVSELSERDFASDALQPFVIAGDLALIEGLDCERAVARAEAEEGSELRELGAGGQAGEAGAGGDGGESGSAGAGGSSGAGGGGNAGAGGTTSEPPLPPKLRVRGLPVLPAGTLAGGRSYLLVAAGCLGGPAFTDPNEQVICGPGYAADAPTLTPILVTLSRLTQFGEVGLQVVHASLATPGFDLRVAPPPDSGAVLTYIASGLTLGKIAPRPPRFGSNDVQLGATRPNYRVDVVMDGTTKSEYWPSIIARGGSEGLENGKTYALVVVGPRADVGAASWWNQAVVTAVPTDPL
jgi:hypothetical protein